MGGPLIPVGVTAAAVVRDIPGCIYHGLSIRDTSGATNTITVYDNASAASGTVLASFTLAAGATASEELTRGLACGKGIYFQSTGAVVGSVRVG